MESYFLCGYKKSDQFFDGKDAGCRLKDLVKWQNSQKHSHFTVIQLLGHFQEITLEMLFSYINQWPFCKIFDKADEIGTEYFKNLTLVIRFHGYK